MSDEHPMKKVIERHHIRNSEIAETLHISPGRVSQILNGNTRMSKEHETQLREGDIRAERA